MDEYIKRDDVLQIITDLPRLYLIDVINAGSMRDAVKKIACRRCR